MVLGVQMPSRAASQDAALLCSLQPAYADRDPFGASSSMPKLLCLISVVTATAVYTWCLSGAPATAAAHFAHPVAAAPAASVSARATLPRTAGGLARQPRSVLPAASSHAPQGPARADGDAARAPPSAPSAPPRPWLWRVAGLMTCLGLLIGARHRLRARPPAPHRLGPMAMAAVTAEAATVGRSAPHFEGTDAGGAVRSLGQYRGDYLLLLFYPDTASSPLRFFGPRYREFVGLQTEVLAVTTAPGPAAAADRDSAFRVVRDADRAISERYGMLSGAGELLPGFCIIDREGVLQYSATSNFQSRCRCMWIQSRAVLKKKGRNSLSLFI